MRGPRRFWSLAFQFLMRPLSSGASNNNSTVCITIAFMVTGFPRVERRKKLQAPSSKLQKSSKNRAPIPPAQVERHCDIEQESLLETGVRSLMFQLRRAGCASSATELEVGIGSFSGAWSLGF